jgi:hypothetical protein
VTLPKSAVDVVSSAFEHTRQQLWAPFRWIQWVRIAVLGLATGEMSSAGGCNWKRFGGAPKPAPTQGPFDPGKILHSIDPALLASILLVLIGGAIVLALVWIYVSSISRFMLFDAVLRREAGPFHDGWQRWQDRGISFFWWQLGLSIVGFVVAAVLFLPLLLPVIAVLRNHQRPGAELLLAFLPMFGVFALFGLVMGLIAVLAKDFVVPLMALEGLGVMDAWRRLLGMLKNEKGSYAGYIAMKVLLSIGASIIFGILSAIAAVIVVLPTAIVGVIVAIIVKGAGMGWNEYTLTALIVGGTIFVGLILCVIALVCVPVAVFFPAYAMYFFAERYPALHARLYPATPPVQAAPIVPPFSPPPEPIG